MQRNIGICRVGSLAMEIRKKIIRCQGMTFAEPVPRNGFLVLYTSAGSPVFTNCAGAARPDFSMPVIHLGVDHLTPAPVINLVRFRQDYQLTYIFLKGWIYASFSITLFLFRINLNKELKAALLISRQALKLCHLKKAIAKNRHWERYDS